LDEEISTEKSVSPFGFRLKRLSEEEISGVKKKDPFPLFSHLGNKSGLLGDPAKGTPESATGFDLTHHIVGVDDAELGFG
jgi:hypothetical protein